MFIFTNLVDDRYNKDIDEEIVKFSKLLKLKTIEELRENFKGDEVMKDYVDESIEVSIDCNFGESYDKEWALKDEGWRDGKLEGKLEGEKNMQIEIVKAMLKEKLDVQTISKCVGLSIDEIEEL